MLPHILPNLITKSLCCWVLGALSATMKIHLQMSIHYNGLIVSGRTAGRPDWDRGGWQPACMANKLTRDPCDNEWLQRRVSVRARERALGQRTYCRLTPGAKATTTLSQFCFSPLEAVTQGKVSKISDLSASFEEGKTKSCTMSLECWTKYLANILGYKVRVVWLSVCFKEYNIILIIFRIFTKYSKS